MRTKWGAQSRQVPAVLAREAGFRVPIALTAAVWADCVQWSDEDSN
ncbi:hypothetical protein [Streptomyces sp. RB17]|nr:hypothetical protein [Streptomyces sp. RB17]